MIIEKSLYEQIQDVMPIPCVDLFIVNNHGEVLLAKRTNEPAAGAWWFPGGRVHYLESRFDAAVRKLREECGIEAAKLAEMGTYDVIVERQGNGKRSHAITTVFIARVGANTAITLDTQSSDAEWRLPLDWLNLELNAFIRQTLIIFINL